MPFTGVAKCIVAHPTKILGGHAQPACPVARLTPPQLVS